MKNRSDILDEALQLSLEDRALMVSRLIESLDGEADEDVEAAWNEEIAKRLKEIDDGTAKMVPWEEVRRKMRGILDAKRD